MANKDQQLKVELTGGLLTISIGVSLLVHAVTHGPGLEQYGASTVTDEDGFAREIVEAMQREEEDGTNAVHRMLDAAAIEAIEDGAEHIRFAEDD